MFVYIGNRVEPRRMFMNVRMCECIVCMKEKLTNFKKEWHQATKPLRIYTQGRQQGRTPRRPTRPLGPLVIVDQKEAKQKRESEPSLKIEKNKSAKVQVYKNKSSLIL